MSCLRHVALSFAVSSVVLLTGCASGTVKETLGLSRNSPDEFRVLPRPPLSVPPQFGLRPPALPGEVVANGEVPANKQAEALVLGTTPNTQGDTFKLNAGNADTAVRPVEITSPSKIKGKTGAETQFLHNVGAAEADPTVRTNLMKEAIVAQPEEEESSWWDIMPDSKTKEPIVDPKEEKERIQQNKADNKPITEGETPSVKPKDRGVLGTILGD